MDTPTIPRSPGARLVQSLSLRERLDAASLPHASIMADVRCDCRQCWYDRWTALPGPAGAYFRRTL